MDPCDIVAQGGRQERRVGVKTLFREKTRRGRRAGVSAREKSRSLNLCSTSEATSDESLGPTNKDEEESFSKHTFPKTSSSSQVCWKPNASLADLHLKRLLENVESDLTLSLEDGYLSQDDETRRKRRCMSSDMTKSSSSPINFSYASSVQTSILNHPPDSVASTTSASEPKDMSLESTFSNDQSGSTLYSARLAASSSDSGLVHAHNKRKVFVATEAVEKGTLHRRKKANDDKINACENLIELAHSQDGVSKFAKNILSALMPLSIWGSVHNLKSLMRSVDAYIRLGRHESMTMSQIAKGIKTSKIPWLRSVRKCLKVEKVVAAEVVERDIFLNFLYWIFSSVLNSLLSCCFYVTESESTGNEVLYYRRPVWAKLLQSAASQIGSHFRQVLPDEVDCVDACGKVQRCARIQERDLPRVRFLPKKTSLRAITNLRSSKWSNGQASFRPIRNSQLYNFLHVLKASLATRPWLTGFGAFSIDTVYERHAQYRRRILGNAPPGCLAPVFYIAALDLDKCFDNVDTKQLYDLVRDILCESPPGSSALGSDQQAAQSAEDILDEELTIHRYTVAHFIHSMERTAVKGVKFTAPEGDFITFEEAVGQISQSYPSSIISDQVVYSGAQRRDLLRLLREHLFSHQVLMPLGERCRRYVQIKGIPQGSVLSPMLCNLYFGNAERKVFGSDDEVRRLSLGRCSQVTRLMDDYLFVSTDKEAVLHFLQRAHNAFKRFGGGFNPLKTRVNFPAELELEGQRINLQQVQTGVFPWCGLEINMETLEVRPSVARLLERPLRNSITVECSNTGRALRRAIKSFVRSKCHGIVLDSSLNRNVTVLHSVYSIFLVAAMRSHSFLTRLGPQGIQCNIFHVVRCIYAGIIFGARLVHSRTKTKRIRCSADSFYVSATSKDDDAEADCRLFKKSVSMVTDVQDCFCALKHGQIISLGLNAFVSVLERHRARYKYLLKHIGSKLKIVNASLSREQKNANMSVTNANCSIFQQGKWL
jgi:telomerase reverse transcriptase